MDMDENSMNKAPISGSSTPASANLTAPSPSSSSASANASLLNSHSSSSSSSSSSLSSSSTITTTSTPAGASTSISGLKPLSCRLIRTLLGDTTLSLCPNKTMHPTTPAGSVLNNNDNNKKDSNILPTSSQMSGTTSSFDLSNKTYLNAFTSTVPPGTPSCLLPKNNALSCSSSSSPSSAPSSYATPPPTQSLPLSTEVTPAGNMPTTNSHNCYIKSLITTGLSYLPTSKNCSSQVYKKFCRLADGCKKPVSVSCGSSFGATSSTSSTPSLVDALNKSAEAKIKAELEGDDETKATQCQSTEPTTNNFINQIISDTVKDPAIISGCQQLRAIPPASGQGLTSVASSAPSSSGCSPGQNFVQIIDSVIANIFQTEQINSQSLVRAAKEAELRQKCAASCADSSAHEPSKASCLSRGKPSESSSLDSGILMMDCTSPTAESVANMTDIAVHELIAGRRECWKKPINERDDCDRANISTAVYQQLIEFELTNDSILKKFQVEDDPSAILTASSSSLSARFDLNRIEKEKLEGLEKAFFPLQLCFSSITDEDMWKRLKRSFWSPNSNINLEYQRQSLLAATESAINMLIVMTKQLPSFMTLPNECQRAQLRSSVMEIMMIRSLLVSPQRLKNQSVLKACAKRHRENSIGEEGKPSTSSGQCSKSHDSYTQKYYNFIHQPAKFLHTFNECRAKLHDSLTKPELEPCNHNLLMKYLYENEHLDENMVEEYLLAESANSECSRDGSIDDGAGEGGNNAANDPKMEAANELAKQYRKSFLKLAKSIDKEWHEDKHIFHLLLVILLFRPVNTIKNEIKKKIREEHLTYVYLLKRYLESKFRSYCTARSHFIRLFDRLEEIQKMNDHIVQKLLDYDLICAQNLLENLCVC